MNILGLSFGRPSQRCDILVKEALFAAHEAGADVRFLNTMALRIDHCHACDFCSRCRERGDVEIHCCLKDDYHVLEEAWLDCDGIVIAAPVYAVGIGGQFKNFLDRLCPSHDRATLLEANRNRQADGKPLLDPRYFRDRYSAYISVGGAHARNWVALGLPMLHLFDFSTTQKCVGHVDAYDQGNTGSPILDRDLLRRCASLGTALAEAVGRPYSDVDTWAGDPDDGVCPVCHCRLLNFSRTGDVECPICGIQGRLEQEEDGFSVSWSEEQLRRARNTLRGVYEHYDEIQNMIRICVPKLTDPDNAALIEREMERYARFDTLTGNP